jgi:hypothetical protein
VRGLLLADRDSEKSEIKSGRQTPPELELVDFILEHLLLSVRDLQFHLQI